MKKKGTWKLVVGILFVLGSLSLFGDGSGDGFIGLVIGALLIGWWYLQNKEAEERAKETTELNRQNAEAEAAAAAAEITEKEARYNRWKHAQEGNNKLTCNKYSLSKRRNISRLKDYVVLDTETTGLSRSADKIIDIAIVKVVNGEIAEVFNTFVNPQMPIPPAASKVNHIYDKDVADAPSYSDIADKVADMVLNQVVIGHNVTFDLDFIGRLITASGYEGSCDYIDTLHLTKKCYLGLPNYKLQTIISFLGIEQEQAHRALSDTNATLEVFKRCQSALDEQLKSEADARRAAKASK